MRPSYEDSVIGDNTPIDDDWENSMSFAEFQERARLGYTRRPATAEIARKRQEYLGLIPHDDPVNHPAHYTSHPSGVECITITRHYPFCTGNALKYLWRAGLKHESGMDDIEKQIQDLEKAAWYIQEHIRLLRTGEASG